MVVQGILQYSPHDNSYVRILEAGRHGPVIVKTKYRLLRSLKITKADLCIAAGNIDLVTKIAPKRGHNSRNFTHKRNLLI